MWNKTAKQDIMSIVIVGLIVFVLFQMGVFKGFGTQSTSGTDGGTAPTNEIKIVGAPCTQATTMTSSVLRRYTDATLSSENVTIYQNGVRKAAVPSGSTATVQSGANGDALDLYVAEDRSTTYYTQHAKGKLETCTGSATTGDPAFKFVQDSSPGGTPITYAGTCNLPDGTKYDCVHKVVTIADGMSITGTNDGQSNAQTMTSANDITCSGCENLSIGSGSTGSVALQFKVDYNEGLGVIGGNVLACQFPSAIYDAGAPLSFTVNGANLVETNDKPSSQQYVLYQSNNTVKAWKFPAIDGRLTPVVPGTAVIRAASSRDPSALEDRINCTVFDTDYYVRERDGALVLDTENRDTNADLGGTNTVYDFVIGVE